MASFVQVLRRTIAAIALCAALVGLAASPAHARVFVGFGFPFYGPGYYPPPPYYYAPPPPVYYAPPPPVVYAPPQAYSPPAQSCTAGPYVCPMDRPVAAGSGCYCLGNGGQRVWGRAN